MESLTTNEQQQVAIIVAPNGARKSRNDHPSLPITHDQIISEIIACRDSGAAMVHLHARDNNGQHTLAIDDNTKVLEAVRNAVGDSIIVQLTTESIGMYTPPQQMELIRNTQPEAASFGLRELIPNDNALAAAAKFFQWVSDTGTIAQYILYSKEDVDWYFQLLKIGVIPAKNHHTLLVLGRYHNELQSQPTDLLPLLTNQVLDRHSCRWAVCAFGVQEQQCLISAMLLGADVRVGFENNHLNNRGLNAENNAQQVNNIKQITDLLGIKRHNAPSYRSALTS